LNGKAELKTVNPATEEIMNRYEIMTKEQINDKAKKARNRFQDGKKMLIREQIFFMILRMN
jgi:acyl-CoA reductase-like NAD-dependent aldehyde dehydrogenase